MEEEKKKTKIIKHLEIKKVKKTFDICDDCSNIISSHVHLKGAISLVENNEEHKIKLTIPEILV